MFSFEPSRENGAALRARMDSALWSSVAEVLDIDEFPTGTPPRATPLDYGAYADLALAVPAWQEFDEEARAEAEAHLRRRVAGFREGNGLGGVGRPPVRNFSNDSFSPIQLQRFDRWFAPEESNYLHLDGAPPDRFGPASESIVRGLDFMEKAVPGLFEETVEIIDQVITVCPGEEQRLFITGGSSFALWGAMIYNAEFLFKWPEAYNTLVHEGAHMQLFAIARDEPLVLNPNEDLFFSPVRPDLRPMDGIFHAAFVAAREALADSRLLEWDDRTGEMNADERAHIFRNFEGSVIGFWQCVEAMDKDAELSALGQTILDECKDYMTSHFALEFE